MSRRVLLDADLAGLATLSPAQLREEWRRKVRKPLPRLSTAMLRLALGYALQAKAHGGLSRTACQQLDGNDEGRSRAMPLVPGMRLVREWQGSVHVVTVDETGVIHWNDRSWNSLSEVARAITGTRWSGPAFFGLRQRKAA